MHVGISGESSRSLERSDGASGNNGLPVYISRRSDEDCARKSENDRESEMDSDGNMGTVLTDVPCARGDMDGFDEDYGSHYMDNDMKVIHKVVLFEDDDKLSFLLELLFSGCFKYA